jgi:hypothetical protein
MHSNLCVMILRMERRSDAIVIFCLLKSKCIPKMARDAELIKISAMSLSKRNFIASRIVLRNLISTSEENLMIGALNSKV